MTTFAVILSGNGVYDGSEIHEVVLSMLAINKSGAEYCLFAPDIAQYHVVNHLTGTEMNETRNVLVEAARIARGKIKPLSELKVSEYDALMIPGGFGSAKNLSNYAFEGVNCIVNADMERVIKEMIELKKPIGALCISPVLLAKIIGNEVELTIGKSKTDISAIREMGAHHSITDHGEIIFDRKYKVVTSPCYMLDANIEQIAQGAENVVNKIMELLN